MRTSCFSLIWLGVFFVLDPLNYSRGAPSIIRDWENGNPRRFFLLLTAGLLCGLLWEFWNFWAASKWVYTVPFFDQLKIFEMPVAGFLGFPPFAVEAFVFYNFLSLFRFRRNWDKDSYLNSSDQKVPGGLIFAAAILTLVFYAVAFSAIDSHTVWSFSY